MGLIYFKHIRGGRLNNFLLLKIGGLLEIGFLIPGLQCVTEISFITVSTRNTQLCTDFSVHSLKKKVKVLTLMMSSMMFFNRESCSEQFCLV